MYTEENLKEKYDELRQKIASTTITDEAFNEIESELLEFISTFNLHKKLLITAKPL